MTKQRGESVVCLMKQLSDPPYPPGQLPRGHSSIMEPPEISQGKIWQLPPVIHGAESPPGQLPRTWSHGSGPDTPGAIWQRASFRGVLAASQIAGSRDGSRGRGRILAASPGKNRTPSPRGKSQNSKALYSCHWSHGAAGTGRTSQRIPESSFPDCRLFSLSWSHNRHHEAAFP